MSINNTGTVTIPIVILLELEDIYNEVIPSPKDSIETIMYRAGQRSVIKYLSTKYDPNGVRYAYKR